MQHRGRKSAEEQEALANLTQQRPDPPSFLTKAQKDVWRRVVDAMRADWFRDETLDLLVEYCQQVTLSRTINKRIEAYPMSAPLADLQKLQYMKDKAARLIATLATKMRITQQSTYHSERKKVGDAPAVDPWSSLQ